MNVDEKGSIMAEVGTKEAAKVETPFGDIDIEKQQGVFVVGTVGGIKERPVKPDESKGDTWDEFVKVSAWVQVAGSEYSAKVTAHRGENDAFKKALEPLVGRVAIIQVWPDNYRELHFVSVVQ